MDRGWLGTSGQGTLEYELRLWRLPDDSDTDYLSIHVRGAQEVRAEGQMIEFVARSYKVFEVLHPLPLDGEDLSYVGSSKSLTASAFMPVVKAR